MPSVVGIDGNVIGNGETSYTYGLKQPNTMPEVMEYMRKYDLTFSVFPVTGNNFSISLCGQVGGKKWRSDILVPDKDACMIWNMYLQLALRLIQQHHIEINKTSNSACEANANKVSVNIDISTDLKTLDKLHNNATSKLGKKMSAEIREQIMKGLMYDAYNKQIPPTYNPTASSSDPQSEYIDGIAGMIN